MRKLIIFGLFFLSLFLFGCKKNDLNKDEVDALNALDKCKILYQEGDSEANVTKNVVFAKPNNADCVIEISDENVISKQGIVKRQSEDKIIDVKFTVSLNGQTFEKTFKLTVKKMEKDNSGIGDNNPGGNTGSEHTGSEVALSEATFTGLEAGATPIVEGWTLNVSTKGAYSTGWLSFRNDGEYIISDILESKTGNVRVSFTYYMNNIGKTGSSSSKIKISILDKDNNIIDEYLSNELNQLGEGEVSGNINYAKTLAVLLGTSKAEFKVKVEFVKDGGGNIGFGSVAVSDVTLEG